MFMFLAFKSYIKGCVFMKMVKDKKILVGADFAGQPLKDAVVATYESAVVVAEGSFIG